MKNRIHKAARTSPSSLLGRVKSGVPDSFEALEPRAMLSYAAVSSMTVDGQTMRAVVDYHGGVAMDTLGNGDIQFAANGRPTVPMNLAAAPEEMANNVVRAVYVGTAYEGAWDYTDTGTYRLNTPAGQVMSSGGAPLEREFLASYWKSWTNPKAQLTSQQVRASDWLVTITYSGLSPINASTIDTSDVALSGPFSSARRDIVSTQQVSANSVRVTYSIAAPDGAWDWSKSGRYEVRLNYPNIKDVNGREANYGALAAYNLWFATPKVVVGTTSVGTNDWTIPIVFAPRPGRTLNTSQLQGDGAITVTGPGSYSRAGTLVTLTQNPSGSYTGIYKVQAPGGSWDYGDNGQYTVSVTPGRVLDTQGAAVTGIALRTYPLSFSNPAARFALPATTPTANRWDISIDFTDNGAINPASLSNSSIRVEGPGGATYTLSLLGTTSPSTGVIRATFRLDAPAGLTTGRYTVWVNQGGVRDTQGVAINGNFLASFWHRF